LNGVDAAEGHIVLLIVDLLKFNVDVDVVWITQVDRVLLIWLLFRQVEGKVVLANVTEVVRTLAIDKDTRAPTAT
jgi:hypothetical protein